jgi:chaperonin GroES
MIKPLHDRILIKPFRNSEFSTGGIYQGSPMTTFVMDKEKAEQVTVGEVLAVGEGKYNRKGQRRPVDVPIGSWVCFSDTCGKSVTEEGEDYLMIREGDVYGYLPEPTTVENIYRSSKSLDSSQFHE